MQKSVTDVQLFGDGRTCLIFPKLLAIVNGWAMSCQLVNVIIDTPSPMYLSVSHYQFTLRFGVTLYVSVTDVHNQSQSVHLVCLGPDVDIS